MGVCLRANLLCVRVCVHMHVFCINVEEYAQHREACRLPSSRTVFFSFSFPLCHGALVSAAFTLVQSAAF